MTKNLIRTIRKQFNTRKYIENHKMLQEHYLPMSLVVRGGDWRSFTRERWNHLLRLVCLCYAHISINL